MNFISKLAILSVAFNALILSSSNVKAAEKPANEETSQTGAVLFRIENIEPQKNKDDLIDKCKFMVTVYNRTAKEISNASLKFKWQDNIDNKYKVVGDKIETKSEQTAKTIIEKEVILEKMLPHMQKSFAQIVDTDKCFLLFDQLEYTVESCYYADENVVIKDGKKSGNGSCTSIFNYINTQNPEYYSEFKDVPDSIIEKQQEMEKSQELLKVQEGFDAITKEMQETEELLKDIK